MNKQLKEKLVKLKGGECNICGYKRSLSALHFHHVNPFEKKFNISDRNKLDDELIEELDKCILVCAACHAECHEGQLDIEYLSELLFDSKLTI